MRHFALAFVMFSLGATFGCGGGGGNSVSPPPGGNVQAPFGLTYAQTNAVYQVGLGPMGTGNMPTYSGGAPTSYTIAPALPSGLHLIGSSGDTAGAPTSTLGTIWGTPTVVSPQTSYTVTASNSAGSTTALLEIAVADAAGTWRQAPLCTCTGASRTGARSRRN